MTTPARRDATDALIALAASAAFQDRADAGYALARFLDGDRARRVLAALLLDAEDTFVTLVTARALLGRQDSAGLEVVALVLPRVNELQEHYIDRAVTEVFGIYGDERDRAAAVCGALSSHADAQIRDGARQLAVMLAQIRPVLVPDTPATVARVIPPG